MDIWIIHGSDVPDGVRAFWDKASAGAAYIEEAYRILEGVEDGDVSGAAAWFKRGVEQHGGDERITRASIEAQIQDDEGAVFEPGEHQLYMVSTAIEGAPLNLNLFVLIQANGGVIDTNPSIFADEREADAAYVKAAYEITGENFDHLLEQDGDDLTGWDDMADAIGQSGEDDAKLFEFDIQLN